MRTMIVYILVILISSCSLPSMTLPDDEFAPSPTPLPNIERRLNGTYTMAHMAGTTHLIFNPMSNVMRVEYVMRGGHKLYMYYPYYAIDGRITTYTKEYPIEEYGEFYNRPYRISEDNNVLVVVGRDTHNTTDAEFSFRRIDSNQ